MAPSRKPKPYVLKYNCGPVALKFHADIRSRVKFLIGVFGTGKTTSAGYDMVMLQSKRIKPDREGIRRSRFAIVRNTIPMLKDTVIKTFLDWYPPSIFGVYKETQRIYLMKIEDREIEIMFRGLDDDKDVRNLLSLELTGAWIEEAREIGNSVFKGVLGRTKRFPSQKIYDKSDPRYYLSLKDWVQFERDGWRGFDPDRYRHLVDEEKFTPYLTPPQTELTSNYPDREHWLYRDFVANPIDGYAIYEQGQAENAHNLSPDYYSDLEKDYADRPDLLQTLVRGEWGVTIRGQQVYPEFDRRIHVSPYSLLPERKVQIIVGWDNTGLHPAISLSYINNIGQWCVFKEFTFFDEGITSATETLILWCDANLPEGCTYRHIGDPAGKNRDSNKKSPADYISGKARDYNRVITIEDGIQTFKIRRESVANRLGYVELDKKGNVIGKKPRMINQDDPAFLVDPSCVRLIDGFEGGYAFPERGHSGTYADAPDKTGAGAKYTDIQDSLQYVATRLFPVKRSRGEVARGLNEPRGTFGVLTD